MVREWSNALLHRDPGNPNFTERGIAGHGAAAWSTSTEPSPSAAASRATTS